MVTSGVAGVGQAGVVESWVDQQRLTGLQRTQLEVRAALGRVAVQLNESLNLEVVLDRVCREAVAILGGDKACVYRCAALDGVPVVQAAFQLPAEVLGTRSELDKGLAGQVAGSGRAMLTQDLQELMPQLVGSAMAAVGSCLAVPLRWDGAVGGVLCVGYTAVGVASPARLELLEDFGVLAAGAFRNAALQSELARTARTDGLTGCVTQTALYAVLEEELQRCARQQLPLSVLLLDLDDFKAVNDTFGHLAGDRVLRAVGQALRSTVRPYDLVARYGGDEFVVLAPGTQLPAAGELAERLQTALTGIDTVPGVTATIGVSSWQAPQHGTELIDAADRALLAAKRGRRKGRVELGAGRPRPHAGSVRLAPLPPIDTAVRRLRRRPRPPAPRPAGGDLPRVLAAAGWSPVLGLLLLFLLDEGLAGQLSRGPVLLAASAAGALLSGYLLRVLAATSGQIGLRWLSWVLGVAAGVAVIRGLVPGLEAGTGTESAPDAAARISLLQTLVLPAFALLAQRRWRAANPMLLVLWVGVTGWWLLTAHDPAPHQLQLITPAGALSGLGRAVLAGLLLCSAAVTIAWWRRGGWRPWDPNTWIGVLLAANTVSIALFLAAHHVQDSWWWASVAVGAARFVLPGLGLLAVVVRLYRATDRYRRALEQRVAQLLSQDTHAHQGAHPPDPATHQRTRRLLDPGGLTMAFQPVIELATGRHVGLEALARATGHPDQGADTLFREAARCGLADDVEFAAIAAATAALPHLPNDSYLAVNLSPHLVHDSRFTALFNDLPLRRLVLEITEQEAIQDFPALRDALQPLRDQGLRLAIDDTGAGYAGLRHLLALQPEIIKLDLVLVTELLTSPAPLATALVNFARTIGSQLIAEGIEDPHTISTLLRLGITHGQGFALARPAPLATQPTQPT